MNKIRIATRASELALWQANYVAKLLREVSPNLEVELVDVTTVGDQDQSQSLRDLGGTGVFTREVQRAVLDSRAEIAVHSLKDLPTAIVAPELTLAAVPVRANRWDAIVLPTNNTQSIDSNTPLDLLLQGAKVGSGSPRRQAQLLAARPDLQLMEIRGNLNTRLKKLDAGEYDAIILAAAGLERLGWQDRVSAILQPPIMYPAVGQGALGIECKANDTQTLSLLAQLTDNETKITTLAERAVMARLEAGCHAPLGVDCTIENDILSLTVIVLNLEGTQSIKAEKTATLSAISSSDWKQAEDIAHELGTASELGTAVADQLLQSENETLIAQISGSWKPETL